MRLVRMALVCSLGIFGCPPREVTRVPTVVESPRIKSGLPATSPQDLGRSNLDFQMADVDLRPDVDDEPFYRGVASDNFEE